MKSIHQIALGGGAAMLLAGAASADFLGIDVFQMTNFFTNDHPNADVRAAYANAGLRTFRLYATFDAPDTVDAWGGDGQGNEAYMTSLDNAYYNYTAEYGGDVFHYNFAPTAPFLDPGAAFDTFGTIGNFVNSNAQAYKSENDLAQASGNFQADWTLPNQGYFLGPDNPEGVASQTQQGLDSDGYYRVLLFQVSIPVEARPIFSGQMFIGGRTADGGHWEQVDANFKNIPGPAALGLLGVAGLFGARRDRWQVTGRR